MIKIKRKGSGFQAKFIEDDGQQMKVLARDVVALNLALNHYYGVGGHSASPVGACPLCQMVEHEQAKKGQKV